MDIDEKRVYDDSEGRTRIAVASGAGLAVVAVSDDIVGEFGLALRVPVHDLAVVGPARVVAATDEGVSLVSLDDGGIADVAAVESADLGPTTAVAVVDDTVVAATGGVVRRAPLEAIDAGEDGAWVELGEADVRAADGRLLATAAGVARVGEDGLDHVGLADARDVAAAGPLAATADGCYRLGPGWTRDLDGAFEVVAAGGDRAHAVSSSDLHARIDGEWRRVEWPDATAPTDLAYDDGTYAVTGTGTVFADVGDGWRSRSIGLPAVVACAVLGR